LDQLEERLGIGELTAELNALGRSIIRETMYPGVWWIEHRNTESDIVGRYIEITRAPEILMSQDADIGAGRAQLGDGLERAAPGSDNGADNEPRPN
jgi:hydrogenase-1 operon protein HyaF